MTTNECEPALPPAEMFDLVRDLIRRDYRGSQKRQSPRLPLVTQVSAVPVDEDFQQTGAPFIALSRNISTGGICLVATEPIRAGWLRLKLKSHESVLHAKVLRCRQLKKYFEIGCEFVSRPA
jgi:hypothetical protein